MKNLIRKLIYRLEKRLDLPKYRVKHENIMVHVSENYVHISYKNDDHLASMSLTKDSYFAIRDKIKSFDRKHEKDVSDTVASQ